jgi:hypothetical protein
MNFRHLIGFIFCRDFGGAQASTCAGDGCCASQQISGPMSQLGLGRAKTSAVAPYIEIIPEQLHLWESNHTAHARFDALLENCVFYISRMYEFLHSQGQTRPIPVMSAV